MNKVFLCFLFAAFVLTGAGYAQTIPPAGAAHEHRERGEKHPMIHAAINKLRAAKAELEKAAHDYGGHRVKAIEAIDRALEELRDALQSDKT